MSLLFTEPASYSINRTVRKASKLRALFPDAPTSQLEVIELPSLVSDYTEAVKGVGALIHVASPNYLQDETGQEVLEVPFFLLFI
jgi:hypothetical protein